ncbi:alpha-12 mannosyltransferase ktr1 [Anaeramoeba flamelloides]|uniref:Alpha-12 mannosyltransferase ktr1 n=1 Tax=Anaeramoeba flamelloides TaxID=1746091 RepID=A0AAV7YYP8_9EUKA|nr:alpha-12 mannosyltransferase ktr1 [Anaeramoeba flamelloides]
MILKDKRFSEDNQISDTLLIDMSLSRIGSNKQTTVPTLETKLNEVSLLKTQQFNRNQQLLEKSRKVQNKKSKLLEMAREMEHLLKNLNHSMKTVEQNLNEEVLTDKILIFKKSFQFPIIFCLNNSKF